METDGVEAVRSVQSRELQAPGGRSWSVPHGGCMAKGMGCCPCDCQRLSVPLTPSGRCENGCPESPQGASSPCWPSRKEEEIVALGKQCQDLRCGRDLELGPCVCRS